LPAWDIKPWPSWLGLCPPGMQAWHLCQLPRVGARCPLHRLPVTGSLPGTQEEGLVEPREQSIPSRQGCQQGGHPVSSWLLTQKPRLQGAEARRFLGPPGTHLGDEESEESLPQVLPCPRSEPTDRGFCLPVKVTVLAGRGREGRRRTGLTVTYTDVTGHSASLRYHFPHG
jgi:hypothetical protein